MFIGIQGIVGTSGWVSFLLNMSLLLIVLIFIYKSLSPQWKESKRENAGSLLLKILFYIPCLFSDGLDFLTKLFTNKESYQQVSSIILIVLFIVFFYSLTNIQKSINSNRLINGNLSSGTNLITTPIALNSSTVVGSYEELNKYDPNPPSNSLQPHNYQYAISFWFYLDQEINQSAFNQFKSIMNYGNKPDVLYRYADNTLMVTMEKNGWREIEHSKKEKTKEKSKSKTKESNDNKNIQETNEGIDKNSTVLYKREKILLQRWNHLLLNYVNGTLDIFYNGELVNTSLGLVPYMTLDQLTVGSDNGNQGSICNVNYYSQALTLENIHILYETIKNKNPPL